MANEMRDLYLFVDNDGSQYLLYVAAGEQAIGIASLGVAPSRGERAKIEIITVKRV